MPINAAPSPTRNHNVVFTSLIVLAVAAAAVTGAAFSGVASGAVQNVLRTAGFGRNDEILLEQRRHAQSLARIEDAVGRVQADITSLKAQMDEEARSREDRSRDAETAPPADRAGNLAQSDPPGSDPEFDLSALRASFDANTVTPRTRVPRHHPRRAGKGSHTVKT